MKEETREQAFDRLAVARTNKALKAIQLIENLGTRPHTHEKTAKIVSALTAAVEKVEYALGGEKEKKSEAGFSLDDAF